MQSPEAIAVQFKGTAGDWTAKVIAIGSPAHVEAAASEAALSIKSGSGIACTYSGADFAAAGLADANKILEDRRAAKAAAPAAIDGRISAATQAAEGSRRRFRELLATQITTPSLQYGQVQQGHD